MIKKFQQGGKQQDAIMQFVEGLALTLLADPQQVIQIAQQNPDALKSAVQVFQQTQDMNQAAQAFQLALQQKTQAAKHGAKLNYLKSLKHQCAEDEEVVYYKEGGSVGCGCKKKMEDGGQAPKGQTPKKKNNVIEKFKNKNNVVEKFKKPDLATKDSIAVNNYGAEDIEATRPGTYKKNKQGKVQWTPDRTKEPYNKENKVSIRKNKPTTPVASKNCGGAVKKFKKHYNGGSLNRIPFMQKGTPKEGIVEKSDNTRVSRVPNNGEGVYEMTPQGIGDFLPLVGTWRAAQRIDKGEPNASYGDLAMNAAMDLLGARMIGSVVKAAGKAKRIHNALKANGFRLVGPEPTKFIKIGNRTKLSRGYMDPNKYYHINLGPEVIAEKTIPNVDYYNIAMLPMILSLRVPATAPFK